VTGAGVGAAHDERERAERRVVEPVLLEERVERAAVAVVTELYPRHVKGGGLLALGDPHDLRVRHEQERRVTIDEPADQPRAGDAIHPGLLSCHPFHRSLLS